MQSAKQGGTKNHFWVFGMTRSGIETRSPGPLQKKPKKSSGSLKKMLSKKKKNK